jgi:S1-C subfamily serine protease
LPRSVVRFVRRVALVSLFAFAAACSHLASYHDKQVSFRQFESLTIDGKSLADFLQQRSAVVVAGAQPELLASRGDEVDLSLKPVSRDGFDIGSATAIATDGYFLTAGHCVNRRPIFLMRATSSGPTILPVRVVWQPPAKSPCDVAVIKVDNETPEIFAFADPALLQPDLDVVTAGANGLAGGKLADVNRSLVPETATTPAVLAIFHNVPLAEGDSGGPLATLDGKLVGIEVLARAVFWGVTQGVALRPDRAWLKETMAADRAARHGSEKVAPTTQLEAR